MFEDLNICRFTSSFLVVISQRIKIKQDEDGVWVAECPAIPGCVSQGQTEAEALVNIEEAIALCVEVRKEFRMPVTVSVS